jgi:hypothetical protein
MPQHADDRRRGKYKTLLILLAVVIGMFVLAIIKKL